jgi:hypothetical protein
MSNSTKVSVFPHGLRAVAEDSPPQERTIRAKPFKCRKPSEIPPRQWLHGKHYVRQFVSVTVAPSGVGKSSKSLVEALSMGTALDLLETGSTPSRQLRVWYWNGEDPYLEIERRIAAVRLHYKLNDEDVEANLLVDSGHDLPIKIGKETKNGVIIAEPLVDEIIQELIDNQVDVLIVDPFVSCHSVNENDNNKIEAVAKTWCKVATRANCSVELVHHVRKGSHGQFQLTVDDGRGATALVAASRMARVYNVMTEAEALDFGVDIAKRKRYFRADMGNSNLAPPPEKADWFYLDTSNLDNATAEDPADDIGVVTRWKPPGAFDNVTTAHLAEVMRRVEEDDYRKDPRAANYVGHVIAEVVDLDMDDPHHKKKVAKLLNTWIKSGALKVVMVLDKSRHARPCVKAGQRVDLQLKY